MLVCLDFFYLWPVMCPESFLRLEVQRDHPPLPQEGTGVLVKGFVRGARHLWR